MDECKNCGTCEWHQYDNDWGEWVCSNYDGEYFGAATAWDDKCPDHKSNTNTPLCGET